MLRSPIIFFNNIARLLTSALQLGEGNATITSGSKDPSTSALSGSKGDLYLSTSTGQLYVKSDAGTTTNWEAPGGGSGTVSSVAISAPAIFTVSGSPITTAGTLALSYSGTALPVANGGTGLTAIPTPTASTYAAWDSNVNLKANNIIQGWTTTATAAGTTTLTVASASIQTFTGSTTQIVTLPVTSTLALGQQFIIRNNSSGNVTVQSSGGNSIQVMASATELVVTCISLSGTGTSSWNAAYKYVGGYAVWA